MEVDGSFGLITKVKKSKVEYWSRSNPDYPGKLFNVSKDKVYWYIDEGRCSIYLGSTKNRRKRK